MRHLVPLSLQLAVPALAGLLGALTLDSPWLVLGIGLGLAAFALWIVVRALSGRDSLDGATVLATGMATLGAFYGYMAGLAISHNHTFPLAACLIAFAGGLAAGLVHRNRAVHQDRIARALIELKEQSVERSQRASVALNDTITC